MAAEPRVGIAVTPSTQSRLAAGPSSRQATRPIVQIVPFCHHHAGGVSDYAFRLAEDLRERHGLVTTFVSGLPNESSPGDPNHWPMRAVPARDARSLATTLETACRDDVAVLLHLSAYGYQKRGVPLWLLGGLRLWRRAYPKAMLLVIFHELFARGRPWNSSFWLAPAQKYIAHQIWSLADLGLTPCLSYKRVLSAWRPGGGDRVFVMPVISNVGEPDDLSPTVARMQSAIVFASPGVEQALYRRHAPALERAVRLFGLHEIVDIGSRTGHVPDHIADVPVRRLGRQPADIVSAELRRSRYGFLSYDATRLGKSTVFAAYAAHGVVPICLGDGDAASDGLRDGEHLLLWNALDALPGLPTPSALPAMQAALTSWYESHSQAKLGALVAWLCSMKDAPTPVAGRAP